jgi:hypothetical protein
MRANVSHSVPMFHVMDIERSVKFYELLGFKAKNLMRDHAGKAFWAWLSCYQGDAEEQVKEESAAIMVTQASGPIDAEQQAVLLYLYSKDLPGLRKRVLAAGVDASAIETRFYMEKGEMRMTDPDGYVVLVGQV